MSNNSTLLYTSDPNRNIYCTDENRTDYFGTGATVLFGAWLSITIFAAIIGNLMVIIVILTNRCRRDQEMNLFLMSLAVADLMVGLLMAPIAFYTTILECWNLGDIMCTINSFVNTTLLSTSIHTLMWISIFKCICITRTTRDLNGEPPKKWVCCLMVFAAWAWGILFALLTTELLGEVAYKEKTMQCGPKYPTSGTSTIYILHTTNQFMSLVLPFGIMIFCYVKIYKLINHDNVFRRQQNMKNDSSVVRTLCIVLVCFVLCWMPYCVYTNYATLVYDKRDIPSYLNPIAYCCGYMNSACNPIIYAMRFPEFRKGYKDIITCKRLVYTVSYGPNGRRRIEIARRSSAMSNTSNISTAVRQGHRPAYNSDRSDLRNSVVPEVDHLNDEDPVFVEPNGDVELQHLNSGRKDTTISS